MTSWLRNERGEWYVILQTVIFAVIALGPFGIDIRPNLPPAARVAAVIVGFALGGSGFLMAMAGLLGLGRHLSIFPHPKDDAELVVGGAYSFVRHPIYSGLIVGAVGWALIHASVMTLLYACILFVFFDVKSRREERYLTLKFPQYMEYKRLVPKLIPFVY
jgi:protein-S-isoprenylcysteine O-methyltransferase Ste14